MGAVAFLTSATGTSDNSTTVSSGSFTVSGSNPYLVVGVSCEESSAPPDNVSAVAWDLATPEAFTQASGSEQTFATNNSNEMWYLANPTAGTDTVTATFAAACGDAGSKGAIIVVAVYTGAKDQAPEAVVSATGSDNTPTDSITTITANAMIVDFASDSNSAATFTADETGQTEREDLPNADSHASTLSDRLATTATAYTMSHTITSGNNVWATAVIALEEEPAAAGGFFMSITKANKEYESEAL